MSLSVPRKLLRGANVALSRFGLQVSLSTTNDGTYWDNYVRRRSDGGLVGSEWKGEEVFLSLLKKYATGDAIEIGCGGGRITSHAVQWFRHVHACDVSREMISANRTAVPSASHHLLDGFTLNGFADHSVDVVFSHDVFVHFSSLQVYPYLAEIRRVLKPGGVGLISFYNFKRHFQLFKEMSLDFAMKRIYPPHMRVHFITEEMISAMLADLDLKLIEVDTSNFLIPVFRS
jgi:ubiquinone/menaquinone biosynthesis C-methylase UbiE